GVPESQRNSILTFCYQHQKNVLCLAQMEDIMISNAKQVILDDAPFLEMEYRHLTTSQRVAKRALDLLVSVPAVILFSPLLLAVAIAIKLDDGGQVFFRQKRATIDGWVFEILKFRTMTASACQAQQQVSASQADQRITRVGRFLRKIRVDELPQLLNVIKGDMSLVGPRPEMLENVAKYKKELPAFVYREKMKAGITGYAQIEGKYNTTPQDKLMLDLTYIESYSIWLDIKLLFRTLTVFFKPDSTEGFEAAVPQEDQKAAQG
ncbi:MAG: exopolysaccharide biosynthesis polyprenyl glycosylphosphotransferase, partial [Clostridia bacterium]|nr:exopolysaccharide biosynthesis polyprenyl glycosylphosphotransferase [Clostridia bacterium]